jgi:hypothetical protein
MLNESELIQDLFENEIAFKIQCFPQGFDVYIGEEFENMIEGFEMRSYSDAVRALAITATYLHPESEFTVKWKPVLDRMGID